MKKTTPPEVGKTASVKVDQELYDDLETMLATGMNVTDAVRSALHIVAGLYRKTWDAGAVPEGVRPEIERFWITRCDAGQWPARGTRQTTVPTAYRARATPDQTGTTPGMTPGPAPRPTGPMTGPTAGPSVVPIRPTPPGSVGQSA